MIIQLPEILRTCSRFELKVVIEHRQASDTALVVAVGRWHGPALAKIYRRHGGAVHGLARRR
jgi:hypothetical protein